MELPLKRSEMQLLPVILVVFAVWCSSSEAASESDLHSVSCLERHFCHNVTTGEHFTCLDRRMECCENVNGEITLFNAPRGTLCCPLYGMYDKQTNSCDSDGIHRRPDALLCPHSSNVYYNANTQVCCQGSSPELSVHLIEEGYACCGKNYVHNSTRRRCAGESYERLDECCTDNPVLAPKEEITPQLTSKRRGCSLLEMEKQFKLQKQRGSFMYAFHVVKQKSTAKTSNTYKVKFAKQFIGKGGKLQAIKSKLKSVTVPKRGCPGTLKLYATYVVMSKSSARKKSLVLRGNKYFILPVESSDLFAKIFSL